MKVPFGLQGLGCVRPLFVMAGLGLAFSFHANGEDLTTLSGTKYHDVHATKVEPDGVTWQHAGGLCKVDFADSPLAIREAYHYDPAKAVAYHQSQADLRRANDEQGQQLIQAHEDRQAAHFQALAAAASARPDANAETQLVFRRAASPAASAATRALAEQMAEARGIQDATTDDQLSIFGHVKPWSAVPRIGNYHPDRHFEVADKDEYKTAIHHAAGGFEAATFHDDFYTPMYMTKSYNEDVDRAAAFARNVPLNP